MEQSDGVFEIREYLDGENQVTSHEIVDIAKELEYIRKLTDASKSKSDKESPVDLTVIEDILSGKSAALSVK